MSDFIPHRRFWQIAFRVKGAWNCVFTVTFYFVEDRIRDWLELPHPDPAYRAMFLALAFIFGLGYWRVGADLTQNRDIVRGGVLGQVAVFAIVANEVFLARRLPLLFLGPAVVDLIFAVLFVVFLVQTKGLSSPPQNEARS
jgi:hypothetical protein